MPLSQKKKKKFGGKGDPPKRLLVLKVSLGKCFLEGKTYEKICPESYMLAPLGKKNRGKPRMPDNGKERIECGKSWQRKGAPKEDFFSEGKKGTE